MGERAPAWVVPAMRAGYMARGAVYGLIGVLALRAAWSGAPAEGAPGALRELYYQGPGPVVLWAIAGGFFGFAAWGLMAAVMDLDCRGRSAKGIIARVDLAATGLLYLAVGYFVGDIAATGSGGSGDGRERLTAWVLSLPSGGWIVILIGVGFIVAGFWSGYKALSEKYRERLRDSDVVERLDPVCKFGWIGFGVVIAILGGFLIWAGWTLDPSKSGGLEDAFASVRRAAFGRILLGALAVGLIAFAIECFVEAAYRVVPARDGADAPTLAGRIRARAEAERKAAAL